MFEYLWQILRPEKTSKQELRT